MSRRAALTITSWCDWTPHWKHCPSALSRESPPSVGLDDLLDETSTLQVALIRLDGVHTVVDSDHLNLTQIVDHIRSTRPDMLS